MLSADELDALSKGQLSLVSHDIAVRETTEAATLYQGAGELRVGFAEGPSFSFTTTNVEPERMVFGGSPSRTPFDELPSFVAADGRGRRWEGRAVLDVTPLEPLRGRLPRVTARGEAVPTLPDLLMVLHTDVEPPLSVWRLEDAEGIRLTLRRREKSLLVVVEASGDVGPDYYLRVEEALWFATRRVLSASAVVRRCGSEMETMLLQPLRSVPHGLFGLPLRSQPKNSTHIGRMLLRYLEYAKSGPAGRFHATSADFRQVLGTSATTIEQSAIAVCIALEAFVRREYAADAEQDATVSDAVDAALTVLATLSVDVGMAQRLRGAVTAIRSPSPRTALRRLASRGYISEQQRTQWEALRHRFVHGLEAYDHDRVIEGTATVFQAWVQLVLAKIGYQGPLQDVSRPGHPVMAIGGWLPDAA